MYDLVRLNANDYAEAMDFINMVFSMSEAPTDFPKVLPKLYQPVDHLMQCNYAMRKEGRIRAVVGSFPLLLHAGRQTLKVSGVGGVSTHPGERQSGLMRQLMQTALDDMKQAGAALSVLGGLRQRYGYYGFERAGTHLDFQLSKTNLRQIRKAGSRGKSADDPTEAALALADTLHLVRLAESGQSSLADFPADQIEKWLMQMKAWHDRQPIHVERPLENFFTVLLTWQCSVWLVLDQADEPVGYLVADSGGQINELMTGSALNALAVAAAWVAHQDDQAVHIHLPPWALETIRIFSTVCESWEISQSYMFKVLDWPAVLTALLQARADLTALPEGHFSFSLTDADQAYQLSYRLGQASCQPYAGAPDLQMDERTATRLFLGPLAPQATLSACQDLDASLNRLLSSWLPLPMNWPRPDGI